MNRPKMRLIIINEETGQELFNHVSEDLDWSTNNDLDTVPTFAGDFLNPPMYSRGFFVNINSYFPNPDELKDRNDCF